MASYTTLQLGEQVRIRGQTRGVYYTVVGRYEQEPIQGKWVYVHWVDRGTDRASGRKLASGSIVRIEDHFYYLRGWSMLLQEGAKLEVIFSWNYESLGLPPIKSKPARPPNGRETRLMEEASQKTEQAARQKKIDAAAKSERENAFCYECGQPNHLVTIPTGAKAWFLKFTYDDERIKTWTCPGGNHIGSGETDKGVSVVNRWTTRT